MTGKIELRERRAADRRRVRKSMPPFRCAELSGRVRHFIVGRVRNGREYPARELASFRKQFTRAPAPGYVTPKQARRIKFHRQIARRPVSGISLFRRAPRSPSLASPAASSRPASNSIARA